MKIYFYSFICILLASCNQTTTQNGALIHISGSASPEITSLSISKDTIPIINGLFEHSIRVEKPGYSYLIVNDKSHIVYTKPNQNIKLNISKDYIEINNDPFNSFIVNKDSLPRYKYVLCH